MVDVPMMLDSRECSRALVWYGRNHRAQAVSVNVVRKEEIQAIRYARENDVPMLGVCLGMQLTCISLLVTLWA